MITMILFAVLLVWGLSLAIAITLGLGSLVSPAIRVALIGPNGAPTTKAFAKAQ